MCFTFYIILRYIFFWNGTTIDNYTGEYTYTCFATGTLIYTSNGYKNIEDIVVGDEVYSYNEETKKVELNKVTKLFVHEDDRIYEIKVGDETIKVTPDHRFFVKTKNENKDSWIRVEDIKIGDYLLNSNGEWVEIDNILFYEESNAVYNIEVENNHTYFVTEGNYLVHNAKDACSFVLSS